MTARSTLQSDHRQSPALWPGPSIMMFLRFALLSAAAWPTAFVAAAEPADAEARAAALAREKQQVAQELARSQTALRETQDTLAKQSAEIGAIRAENAATRIQLGRLQAEAAASHFNPSNLPSAEAVVALEGERTAHRATKAGLNQRENQVQGLVAERTKLESEIRVARASAELASNTARAELRQTQTTLEAARAEATRLAAETLALQGRFATLEREAKAARQPTPADLAAMQIQERQLTALEQELTSTRNLLAQTEARIKSLHETNALLQRELTAATAAARMQDRPTITEEELAQLRIRAAAARELDQQPPWPAGGAQPATKSPASKRPALKPSINSTPSSAPIRWWPGKGTHGANRCSSSRFPTIQPEPHRQQRRRWRPKPSGAPRHGPIQLRDRYHSAGPRTPRRSCPPPKWTHRAA